jgi:hypothetical protein
LLVLKARKSICKYIIFRGKLIWQEFDIKVYCYQEDTLQRSICRSVKRRVLDTAVYSSTVCINYYIVASLLVAKVFEGNKNRSNLENIYINFAILVYIVDLLGKGVLIIKNISILALEQR